jgi:mono-ADP-ribosyltransferase sirtuin 6
MELGSAMPTYAHYAITELIRKQLVSFVTSTNLDGLHVRSGTVRGKISELHGNCYLEICELCEREYLRSFDTLPTRVDRWSHHTGRLCDCGGHLRDTIVHFTENIRRSEWASAVTNARLSDVALVLGTSMNVQPAASLPDKCLKNNGSVRSYASSKGNSFSQFQTNHMCLPRLQLFIVNLQRTPYDEFATLKIYAKTDDFMFALMKELGDEEFNMNYDHCVTLATQEKRALIKKWVYRTASLSAGLAAAGALGYYLLRNKQFSLPAFFRRN